MSVGARVARHRANVGARPVLLLSFAQKPGRYLDHDLMGNYVVPDLWKDRFREIDACPAILLINMDHWMSLLFPPDQASQSATRSNAP